ncbi:energy transducer TonB [Cognatiyoonia sp. IB215182]|uniref:energy transducer TonB n=1 Tax=Cognatiyoonia sp. IB215182 TaxID=3097353 RepID=UPI002A0CD71A|nr:energy transducer TonB [Cognatiyoonia sp. IB215182]MDX8351503.1 energy transducer TonB [Cognatiyoonia sp. IB215182]
MWSPGTYISGIGHAGLITLFILGWGFQSEPLVFDDISVSVLSGEEFEQLRAGSTPEPGEAEPTAPVAPVIDETLPPPPVEDTPPAPPQPPQPVEPPPSEAPPPQPPAPVETDVADAPPAVPAPPPAPPPTPDVEVSDEPTPPQAERITSTPSQPPPPDARVDDVVREEVVPDDTAEAEVVEDEQEPTAPPESATQIGIADLAPTTSLRPVARPSRPAPSAEEPAQAAETDPAPEPETSDQDVATALADALSNQSAEAPAVPAGPPMTGAERDSFRIAVNRCWNVDPGSVAARVTVEVGFSLERDGTVRGNEVRLLSSDGDQSATNTAFEAARRAILRCQSGGYQLPADKYDQWQDVIITFDPSGMRLR